MSAFNDCSSLTAITIPESATSIGNKAFEDCQGLKEIHSLATEVPEIGSDAFSRINTDHCILYVPVGCKEKYASAEGWSAFVNIVEEGEGIDNRSELEKLQAAYEELQQEVEMLRNGDLNKDGSIDIEDVALLISLENYSSDKDALTTLTDGSSISVEEIAEKYGDVEYYSLDGKRVDEPAQSGIYIVKKDGQTKMIVVKK